MYSSNQFRFNYFASSAALAVLLAVTWLQPQNGFGQPLSPIGDKTAKGGTAEVYNLTKTANKYEDFLSISRRCSEMLDGDLSDKDRKYLNSLLGWAENRLAGKELANATGLKSVGLNEQAELELQKAIQRYDDLIESHPKLWRAWMGRAVIHAQAGELEAALTKFRKVLRLDVKNNNARFNCAEILYTQNQFEEAVVEYSKVLMDNATDVQALTGRGHCYSKLKKYSQAADDYLTVTKLQPDSQQATTNLKFAQRALITVAEEQGTTETLTSSKKSSDKR